MAIYSEVARRFAANGLPAAGSHHRDNKRGHKPLDNSILIDQGDGSIYSWGSHWCIARFITPDVVLFNVAGYSPSTRNHTNEVSSALYRPHYTVLSVEKPLLTVVQNLDDLASKFTAAVTDLNKATSLPVRRGIVGTIRNYWQLYRNLYAYYMGQVDKTSICPKEPAHYETLYMDISSEYIDIQTTEAEAERVRVDKFNKGCERDLILWAQRKGKFKSPHSARKAFVEWPEQLRVAFMDEGASFFRVESSHGNVYATAEAFVEAVIRGACKHIPKDQMDAIAKRMASGGHV